MFLFAPHKLYKVRFSEFRFFKVRSSKTIVTCTLALLSACAPPVKVAVEERTVLTVRQQSEKIGGQIVRIVQSGDTLYGVGFESNLDVNQLAAWNGISDTSRLRVGQRIRLTKPTDFVAKPVVKSRPSRDQLAMARVAQSRRDDRTSQKNNKLSAAKSTGTSSGKATGKPKPFKTKSSAVLKNRNVAGVTWSWPFSGKVIRRFSPSSTQQGIDILGIPGQAVTASAPGEVVYVGNSLKGYGNLVIIKHNDNFLSAYAHNQKILVSEGQMITYRQVIGAVGTNNRLENALHFQIRRKGKPVNPLSYLSGSSS
ncbi:MAG: peptidoglycan DD-metalloendopeptidase family protein [Arenicella sp.]|nr:peptidoglycan DD-metalloendopeptidase family protein [Arenicella sp.]